MKHYLIVLSFFAVIAVTMAIVLPDIKKILCSPCKFLFKEVAKELPETEVVTEFALDNAIKIVCKKYLGKIPMAEDVCERLGDEAIKKIYDFILKEDKKINPDSICKHIHMC